MNDHKPWNQAARCPKCQYDRLLYQYVQHLNDDAQSHLRMQCYRCNAGWTMEPASREPKEASRG